MDGPHIRLIGLLLPTVEETGEPLVRNIDIVKRVKGNSLVQYTSILKKINKILIPIKYVQKYSMRSLKIKPVM